MAQPYANQPSSPPPFQAFFRLVIMVGVTAVTGMAFYQYGPPPEQALRWADQAYRMGTEKWNEWNAQQPGGADAPAASLYGSGGSAGGLASPPAGSGLAPSQFAPPEGLRPLAGDFRFDAAVEPTSGISAQSPSGGSFSEPQLLPALASGGTPMPAEISVDPVLAPLAKQLINMGAQDLELHAWGSEGRLHRFSCAAPTGPSGFQRRFDAIEATPQAALERVMNEVWQWSQARVARR